jgi:hypothetical protein
MMKLAYRVYLVTLILLTLVFAASAQDKDDNRRPEKDPRNTAPTVGTGGTPGGATGLFTIYDGQTLRRGEFTFSAAYSNYDRDPGNADIVEIPVSFQFGVADNFELWFNIDAYRAIKVNSPTNLSSFYLPNSQLFLNGAFRSGPAIVAGPFGTTAGPLSGVAVFRPTGAQPFVQFPFIGGPSGFPGGIGPTFGFPVGTVPTISVREGGNGADVFPGMGSVYGSILPGFALQTFNLLSPTGQVIGTAPSVFTLAPTYLPDAPFINRTYGESSFNTASVGVKWRWTGPNNPVGLGIVPFYRFYLDKADDFSGFNQLQRGASPGGNRGDLGLVFFADARVRKWLNVSANAGYILNSSVKADFPGGSFTILDRPDELIAGFGADFPVNKFFQPILEFKSLSYVGGRTPNAFENNPMDFLAGIRIFPVRWAGIGLAYRLHTNQQDRDSFDGDDSLQTSTVVVAGTGQVFTTNFTGAPPGFAPSSDPHGFIIQGWVGRRDKRAAEVVNIPANVTAVSISDERIVLPCPPGMRPREGQACGDQTTVTVQTTATDAENDPLTYSYNVSGGTIVGQGANVSWDLSNARPGTYTITAAVNDGCGVCGQTQTRTITVAECDCVPACECPSLSISGPAGVTAPGSTMTFTANVSGGSQSQVITYNWTVDRGVIESGQGTPSIVVRTDSSMAGGNVTARVDIGGVPADCGCTTTASETAPVAAQPEALKVDEFGKLTNDEIRGKIDEFINVLQANPDDRGYIINYGTDREIAARERIITNHLNFRKFDRSRITMIRGGDIGQGVMTRLYRIPPGAADPTP